MPYIGNTPAEKYAAFNVQNFTTSATTSYTLDRAVANELDIRLVINNVIQQPGAGKAYTAAGTTLTLSAATSGTDTMYCVYIGKAVQTVNPGAGSVGTTALADNAVTNAKLADATQGDVIYYGAAGAPAQLSAGTNGHFLKTQGAGANPTWATVPTPTSGIAASAIDSGTLADARIPDLNASKITAGTMATARLGSGTASSSTFLRGDQTYAEAGGGSWTLLRSYEGTGNSVSNIDFNTASDFTSTSYAAHVFVIKQLYAYSSNDGFASNLGMQVFTSGGIQTGASAYQYVHRSDTTNGVADTGQSTGASEIRINTPTQNGTNSNDNRYGAGYVWCYNLPDSKQSNFNIQYSYNKDQSVTGNFVSLTGMGLYESATSVVGIRFKNDQGAVLRANIYLYGIEL